MRANELLNEAEGDPKGVEHISKELIQHIIQQVGTEGAHAIVKSLQWGDGAAKELLQLIVKDLKQDISMAESVKQRLDPHCWKNKHKEGTKIKGGVRVNNCVANEDWNKVNHHDKTNGLSQKAVNAYRREHPGSKLKTAVTTKPSKLKAGSKDAKRRKSFCARMSGNKGPMKKPNGKPTPKALALRRWNCESIEEMQELIDLASKEIAETKELLNKPTGTVESIAKKHGVSTAVIQAQLKKGMPVELEHTSDHAIAREIALDHLGEFVDYYDRLERAEQSK